MGKQIKILKGEKICRKNLENSIKNAIVIIAHSKISDAQGNKPKA